MCEVTFLPDTLQGLDVNANFHLFNSFIFHFSDDSKGKRQRKILYKTQNYLNLYAADGLRTLCIAKKVTQLQQYNNTSSTTNRTFIFKLFPSLNSNT